MLDTKKREDGSVAETTFSCKRGALTIRGTEYRPQGENLPIAIVSHGFMAFQDTVRHYAKKWAEMGYLAYCFDFCGGCVIKGKSDGPTTQMSVLTEVEDLKAVLQYAQSRPYANPEDVTLMGCSQGGFVSGITAARLKEQITRLVMFYPALCIPDDARAGKMIMAKFDPQNIPKTLRCGPMKLGRCYVADVIGMDPCQELSGFPGDVLIVHGCNDKVVPIEYSRRAFAAYLAETKEQKLQRKVLFYTIAEGGHGFSKKHDRLALQYLENFIQG